MRLSDLHENLFFFPGGAGVSLLGFLSEPKSTSADTGILYCHPFAEEKNCSHAVVAKAARTFAEHGFAVMRFDFSGCGDSEADMSDFRLHDWLEDIHAAIVELKRRTSVQKVILWGLRMGAALAATFARKHSAIDGLLLWQPVFSYRDYMHHFLRGKLASDISAKYKGNSIETLTDRIESAGHVEVQGYPIADPLYSSFGELDGENRGDLNCLVYIATISKMTQPPTMIARKAGQLLSSHPASKRTHIIEEPFWNRYWQWQAPATVQSTLNWLTETRW